MIQTFGLIGDSDHNSSLALLVRGENLANKARSLSTLSLDTEVSEKVAENSPEVQNLLTDKLGRPIKKGSDHKNFGKTRSEDTKNLMAKAKSGVKHPAFKGLYVTPAGKFTSSHAAAKANGITARTIIKRCKGKLVNKNSAVGYSFERTRRSTAAVERSIQAFTTPQDITDKQVARETYENNVESLLARDKQDYTPDHYGVNYSRDPRLKNI